MKNLIILQRLKNQVFKFNWPARQNIEDCSKQNLNSTKKKEAKTKDQTK